MDRITLGLYKLNKEELIELIIESRGREKILKRALLDIRKTSMNIILK